MGPSDAELVNAVRQGQRDAFGALVLRHQGEARALAYSLVGDWAEAEDLTQEAFIRALTNLGLLADPQKFGRWLRRIVFGVSVDWLRAFKPELFRGDADHGDATRAEPRSAEPGALERIEQEELARRVLAAIDRLPPRYKAPLTLYHLDGLSHAMLAKALGVAEGTARSLVTRARQKLATALESYAREVIVPESSVAEVFEEQESGERRFLHVLNGDACVPLLRDAGTPGTLAVWADVLHEGPVPPDDDMQAWLAVRASFLAGFGDEPEGGALTHLRDWQSALESFRDYDEVVLWFEHDLFDQLLLIRHLNWFAGRSMGSTKLSLICIGEYPGVQDFVGLGQLTPDQMASLLDTRQRVTPRQTELGRAAWRAFTSDDPRNIERVMHGDTRTLEFLGAALRRFLEDYPWTRDGLGRTERQALEVLGHGPRSPIQLYLESREPEERIFMGDITLWQRVQWLAAGQSPLVQIDVQPAGVFEMPKGEVRITDAGRAVLEGEADYIALNGIDRWFGGVHLVGDEAEWRWSSEEGRLVRKV